MGLSATETLPFGTLEVRIEIPQGVLEHITPQKPSYFWDRFYIGYTNAKGHQLRARRRQDAYQSGRTAVPGRLVQTTWKSRMGSGDSGEHGGLPKIQRSHD